ncbi:hypothetical protein F5I97DRAFT_1199634 [Phlebopus sp. FC_14]|nr:hypothetical protein F5I97DRAFT_1199634 [Phlebopus sp. FC_14]
MADGSPRPTSDSRQKRVLPSRSRRGGPGIGSCDIDLMILDAQKRRFDNEPLIPADTPFLLTTNSTLLDGSSSASTSFELNNIANQRYFDRPEVIKAYREQQNIQTPEFTLLSEDASVGGRFRPRSTGEQDPADTSDAAYEKRHRKYETFEKRQRLREKEKLKHEQYKLRERIEQLRAMDGSAFLGLPASSFSLPPGVSEDEMGVALPGAHINGAANYNEGERRRQEMLEVASILEERYRTLLPSDKKLADLKNSSRQSSVNLPGPDTRPQEDPTESGKPHGSPKPSSSSIILKIKVPQVRQKDGFSSSRTSSPEAKSKAAAHFHPASPRSRSEIPSEIQFVSSGRPHKRPRASPADVTDSRHSTPDRAGQSSHPRASSKSESCLLMQWSLRNRAIPSARKTQRHVTAFGIKVPPELEEVRDFEIPYWIRPHSPTTVGGEQREIAPASTSEQLAPV